MAEPKGGDRIPGTDYIRCETECVERKRGGDSEKRYCAPGPKNPCTPDDPKEQPERCHCRPFRQKEKGPWEPVETDKDGNFDKDDDYRYRCWCVRFEKEKKKPLRK